MSPMALGVFALFSTIAGFAWIYGVPKVQPLLPDIFTSNQVVQAFTTGVFIVATVFIAYHVTKAAGQGRRAPVRA